MIFNRDSGVLLHPTSLPGKYGSGDLGAEAYRFIDWLKLCKQNLWQVLPLVEIGAGNSPYSSSSAFAGNVLLIDLEELKTLELLSAENLNIPVNYFGDDVCRIDFSQVRQWRLSRLRIAAKNFFARIDNFPDYQLFCQSQKKWLDSYGLFKALTHEYQDIDWNLWSKDVANYEDGAVAKCQKELIVEINFWKFCQWCFYRQWQKLRHYAHKHNIKIIGDMPIYVAYNSADVWANQEVFELEANHQPKVIAGVPPDYFSETGQRWGNPIYNWHNNKEAVFNWWKERLAHTFTQVDIVRIDHFLGFARYWQIPAEEETAINGSWRDAPGEEFFAQMSKHFGSLPIIAEDLGIHNPVADNLRQKYKFPGMRVFQFAWGSGDDNVHLPHNHKEDAVVVTGTHDNQTILGWYNQTKDWERKHLHDYLQYYDTNHEKINWRSIRMCMESPAVLAIFPLQDILGLAEEHRMNTPGVAKGNWGWRFTWQMFSEEINNSLRKLTIANNR